MQTAVFGSVFSISPFFFTEIRSNALLAGSPAELLNVLIQPSKEEKKEKKSVSK